MEEERPCGCCGLPFCYIQGCLSFYCSNPKEITLVRIPNIYCEHVFPGLFEVLICSITFKPHVRAGDITQCWSVCLASTRPFLNSQGCKTKQTNKNQNPPIKSLRQVLLSFLFHKEVTVAERHTLYLQKR